MIDGTREKFLENAYIFITGRHQKEIDQYTYRDDHGQYQKRKLNSKSPIYGEFLIEFR
jgi:hypothetical protein